MTLGNKFLRSLFFYLLKINELEKKADVAKWIKAVDCGSTTRGFNSRRSPIRKEIKLNKVLLSYKK